MTTLTNGMKFFSIALTLVLLTSCNREETNAKIYFKVKNPKDYTDNEYNFEPLTPTKFGLLVVSPLDLSNFTFYDRNLHLIRRAKIEDEDHYDMACFNNHLFISYPGSYRLYVVSTSLYFLGSINIGHTIRSIYSDEDHLYVITTNQLILIY